LKKEKIIVENKINNSNIKEKSKNLNNERKGLSKCWLACGVKNHSMKLIKKGAVIFDLVSMKNSTQIKARVEKIFDKSYEKVYKKKE